jgi:hypothetical protein
MPVEERWAYGHIWFIPLRAVKDSHHFAAVCTCGEATLVKSPASVKPLPWMHRNGWWAVLAAMPVVVVVALAILYYDDVPRSYSVASAAPEKKVDPKEKEAAEKYAARLMERVKQQKETCNKALDAALAKAFPKKLAKTKEMIPKDRTRLHALQAAMLTESCSVAVPDELHSDYQGRLHYTDPDVVFAKGKELEASLAAWKMPSGWSASTRDCDDSACRKTVGWYSTAGEPIAVVRVQKKQGRYYIDDDELYALAVAKTKQAATPAAKPASTQARR